MEIAYSVAALLEARDTPYSYQYSAVLCCELNYTDFVSRGYYLSPYSHDTMLVQNRTVFRTAPYSY